MGTKRLSVAFCDVFARLGQGCDGCQVGQCGGGTRRHAHGTEQGTPVEA